MFENRYIKKRVLRWFVAVLPVAAILLAPLIALAVSCREVSFAPLPNVPTIALVTFTSAPNYGVASVTATPFVNTLIAPRTHPADPTVRIMPVTDTPAPIDTIVPGRNTLTVEGTATPAPTDTPAPVSCVWQTLYRDEQTWLQRCVQ